MNTVLGSSMRRFFNKVVKNIENGCWEWQGALTLGYATFWSGRHVVRAHRWLYESMYGTIDNRDVVDHVCRNKACVNPSHMERVSFPTNVLRGNIYNSSKTHCPRGHEYTVENTYYYKNVNHRVCRMCDQMRPRRKRRS